MIDVIKDWIGSLIKLDPKLSLLDSDFGLEDGMTLDEYLEYEIFQFKSLSKIFDLDNDFSIKKLAENEQKGICTIFFLIINSKEKIVCKTHVSLNVQNNKIIGNGKFSQIVPKYSIVNGEILELGLAIKARFPLLSVKSVTLNMLSMSNGANFDSDNFYTVKFESDNIQNSFKEFIVVLNKEGKPFIERQKIFFDYVDLNLKPYFYNEEKKSLKLNNEFYPVHLTLIKENDEYINYEYPRDLLEINLKGFKSFIVTDSLDNDWFEICH